MPYWRLAIFSVVGFLTPICLALVISPFLFDHSRPNSHLTPEEISQQYARARLDPDSTDAQGQGEGEPPLELAPASFKEVNDAREIDPGDKYAFVVSAKVRFSQLPEVGKRERLFFKYAVNQKPYSGWALALRRWPGSVRPEVYWRDSQGKGGWYTFGDVNLNEGQWYSFTFVVEEGVALSMYISPYSEQQPHLPLSKAFVGGVSIAEVSQPKSLDSLFIPPIIKTSSPRSNPLESSEFFIAEITKDRLAALKRKLTKSGTSLADVFEEQEIRLKLEPPQSTSALSS